MLISIRSRLLASHFGLMLLALLILAPSSYFLMKAHLQHQRSANLQFTARHVAGMLDARVLDLGQRLGQIAGGRMVREFPETARLAAVGEYFARFQQRFPIISYLDAKGWEEVKVVDGHRLPYLEDLSSDPLFNLARQHPNRPLIGPIEAIGGNGQAMLTLVYGIQRYFGDEFVGALRASSSLAFLTSILNDIEVGDTGYLVLLEDTGRLLAYPDPQRIMQQIPDTSRNEKAVKAALNGDTGFVEGHLIGVQGLIAYAPLRQLDASLLVVLPYAEFIAGAAKLRNAISLILVGVAGLGIGGAMFISKRLTRPILGLTGAALRISHGDFPARIDVSGEGEIGQLVKAFNRMVKELRNSTVSRQYFERIIENMEEGLFLVGLDGKVRNVNSAACRILQKEEEQLLGEPLGRFIVEPGAGSGDWLKTLLSSPGTRRSDKLVLTASGEVPVHLIWTVLEDASGTVREVACLFSRRSDQ